MRMNNDNAFAIRQLYENEGKPPVFSPSDVASYVAQMSDELGQLARSKDLTFLFLLLNLAKVEAKRVLDAGA